MRGNELSAALGATLQLSSRASIHASVEGQGLDNDGHRGELGVSWSW
jgi:hypothetical protein